MRQRKVSKNACFTMCVIYDLFVDLSNALFVGLRRAGLALGKFSAKHIVCAPVSSMLK